MADFVHGATLSGAAVRWTTAAVTQQIMPEESAVAQADPTTSDLLQQAMNEVSFETGGGVSYSGGEIVYVQEDGKLTSLDGMIASGNTGMAVMSVPQTTGVMVCGDEPGAVTMDVGRVMYNSDNTDIICEFMPSDPDISNVTSSVTYNNSAVSTHSAGDMVTSQTTGPMQISGVRSLNSSQTSIELEGENSDESVPSGAVETDSAPLGSSGNPIRIIQRGNQYTAMQHLTADQLTQILQVIQEQQQLAQTKNPSSSSSAVLYNPDADDSQVVYRITTSSDSTGSGTTVKMVSDAEHSHQKRIIRKRKREDEDQMVGGELSRQEKEERKKHRPRTRSGRVSKPPQYMVKDYKHIHPVDYDEDYDDSDGGYSDFQNSGDEVDHEDGHLKDDRMLDIDYSGHWKHNKCETCEKRYIGKAGLARHYRLNPTHCQMSTEQKQSSMSVLTPDCSSDGVGLQESSVGSEPQQDLPSANQSATRISEVTALPSDRSQPPGVVKKRGRGRPPVYKLCDKRKAQLKERCSTEELLEVALPKLARIASLWDFLSACLPKHEKSASDISQVLQEYNEFRCQVKSVCEERLSLVNTANTEPGPENIVNGQPSASISQTADAELTKLDIETDQVTRKYFEITSSDVAESLGLVVGRYKYIERRQETSVNNDATAASPGISNAVDSSRCVPPELEMTSILAQDGGKTDSLFDDINNTLWEMPVDEAVGDDVNKLQPTHHQLESNVPSSCRGDTSADTQRDTVATYENKSLASSGNIHQPVMTAELDRVVFPDSTVNGNTGSHDRSPKEECPIITTDVLAADDTCSDTNGLTLTVEMPKESMIMSDDAFCQPPVDCELKCQADEANLGFETSAPSVMQSDSVTDRHKSSSSEAVPLLPTAEDLEGLLKAISRTP